MNRQFLEQLEKKIIMETFPREYQEVSFFDMIGDVSNGLELRSILELMQKGQLDMKMGSFMNSFSMREKYIRKAGYVVVTKFFCKALAEYVGDRKVLEVMSGSGALAKGLREFGVEIKVTDNYSWKLSQIPWVEDVECIEAVEAVRKYGEGIDFLIIGWPPMDNSVVEIIKEQKKIDNNVKIIYIGEGDGGCTGVSGMWDLVEEVEDEKFKNVEKHYRTWRGIHDRPLLFKIK